MTAAGPLRSCASLALAPLLDAPPAPAHVVAATPAAVYLALDSRRGGGVVAVVAPDAVPLPNALVLSTPAPALGRVAVGAPGSVGGGGVVVAGLAVRPVRWWNPRPRLGPTSHAVLSAALDDAAGLVPAWPAPGPHAERLRRACGWLAPAVLALDGARAVVAAMDLLGCGPGTTPAGDDLLAGVLAATRLFGEALDVPRAGVFADRLGAALQPLAARTTTLSVTLLAHAARGELAAPAAAVCRALAGQGALDPSVRALLAVGHTSGHDLAAGLLLGARAVAPAAVPPGPPWSSLLHRLLARRAIAEPQQEWSGLHVAGQGGTR